LGEWWDFCKVKFKDLIVIHSTRLQKIKRTRLNYLRYRLNQWHIKNPIPTPEEEQEKAEIEKDIKMELQRQIEGDKLRAKSLDLDSNDKPWDFFKRLEKIKGQAKAIQELTVENRSLFTQDEIERECVRFYKELIY
jgi:hypothetical protein